MIQSIGETAGKMWEFLNERGEANIIELMKGIGADASLIFQAIGWLAREDKLLIAKKEDYITYSLKA